MIHFIGDVHGDFRKLFSLVQDMREEDTIIQVGDFGVWPQLHDSYMKARWANPAQRRGDMFFIDGNHDYIPMLPINALEMTEIWKDLWYMPRGYVGMVEDKRVLFLGGSKSVDRKWRHCGSQEHGWFPEEQLTESQAALAVLSAKPFDGVDLIVSHTPPDWIIRKHLSPEGLMPFDIDPKTWLDESALLVENVWKKLGEPQLIAGHLHKSIVDGNIRVLGINEVYSIGRDNGNL